MPVRGGLAAAGALVPACTKVALLKTPPVARMTVTEFLVWPADPTGRCWQLIDGEPVAMPPAPRTHRAIQAEVGAILRNHLRAQRSSCIVIAEPGIVLAMVSSGAAGEPALT